MVYLLSIGDYGHYIMNKRWFKEFIGPLCAEGCAFASKGCGFAASPTTKKPGAFPSPMPNEFGVCMVYGRCCTEVRRRAPYTSLPSFLHMWSRFRVPGSLCSSYLLSFLAKLDGRKQGDSRVSEMPFPAGPRIGRKACAFRIAL